MSALLTPKCPRAVGSRGPTRFRHSIEGEKPIYKQSLLQ
jgi:hypothetical protein